MLVPAAAYQRPTDTDYAFVLRAGEGAQGVPPVGARRDVRQVVRAVLGEADAARFEARVQRWGGPEDRVGPEGAQPWAGPQLDFVEDGPVRPLRFGDVERLLCGQALVQRGRGGQVDYLLRDHHMLDVVLDHYRCTGALPTRLFHADRHSDWCRDSYLQARVPQQAATWWALLEGLKRPCGSGAVLRERDVHFTTARAERQARMSGRDTGASTLIPGSVDPAALGWREVLEQPGALEADWLSLDLDYFQPAPQLALCRGLLREARFHRLLQDARVRVFVLSPQFLNGGDRQQEWRTQGGLHSALRVLNLLRALPAGLRARA